MKSRNSNSLQYRTVFLLQIFIHSWSAADEAQYNVAVIVMQKKMSTTFGFIFQHFILMKDHISSDTARVGSSSKMLMIIWASEVSLFCRPMASHCLLTRPDKGLSSFFACSLTLAALLFSILFPRKAKLIRKQ